MLTDMQLKKAKPADKDYKLPDSGGLHLKVSTTGHRSWRLKYRFGEKEKLLTIGTYPEVSLLEAREAREAAKKAIREGRDPCLEKKQAAAALLIAADNTFETCARAWFELNKPRWGAVHAKNVIDSLEEDLFPEIGHLAIKDVDEALLLAALRKVEKRGAIETAHRIRQRASYIKPLMKPKPRSTKQPALVKLPEVRQLIVDVEAERASPITKLANRLIALTVVRSAVQRHCRWTELEDLDGDEPLWRVPPSTMKLILAHKDDESYEHLVPLCRQAVEVINAVRVLTGHLEFLFPNDRYYHRPMSENGVRALIIRANGGIYKGRHCPHGWRTSFSTLMNLWRRKHGRPDDREIIDLMLAHAQDDKTEGAYNRAAHMDRRRELAQIWADMLLENMPPAMDLLDGLRN